MGWRFFPSSSHPIVGLAIAFARCNTTKDRRSTVNGGARGSNPRCASRRFDRLTRFVLLVGSRLRNLCFTCFHLLASFFIYASSLIFSGVSCHHHRRHHQMLAERPPNTRSDRQILASTARSCSLRSLSWNGNEPSLISTAWERHAGGDIAVHQWKGLGKGGLNRLEDWVEVSAANADAGEGVGDDGRA